MSISISIEKKIMEFLTKVKELIDKDLNKYAGAWIISDEDGNLEIVNSQKECIEKLRSTNNRKIFFVIQIPFPEEDSFSSFIKMLNLISKK